MSKIRTSAVVGTFGFALSLTLSACGGASSSAHTGLTTQERTFVNDIAHKNVAGPAMAREARTDPSSTAAVATTVCDALPAHATQAQMMKVAYDLHTKLPSISAYRAGKLAGVAEAVVCPSKVEGAPLQ